MICDNNLLNSAGQAGNLEECLAQFNKIENPNVKDYTICIRGHVNAGKLRHDESLIDCARVFFRKMQESGPAPNKFTYNAMLNGFCEMGRLEEATSLVDEMEESGVVPDDFTFAELIKGHSKFGKMEDAEAVLAEMKRRNFQIGPHPYSMLARGYFKNGLPELGVGILQRMKNDRERPDTHIYNVILNGYIERNEYAKAEEFYKSMGREGIAADKVTYSTLIKGYCKSGSIALAEKVLDFMKQNGFCIDSRVYNPFIHYHLRAGSLRDAEVVFERMKRDQVRPDTVSFTMMIKGCRDLGQPQRAEGYKKAFQSGDLHDNSYMRSAELEHLCQLDQMQEAEEYFDKIPQKSTTHYNIMLRGYIRANLPKLAEFVQMMRKDKVPFSTVTYTTLIENCFRKKTFDEAIKLFREMRESVKPDEHAYTQMMKGFAFEQMVDEIEWLFCLMKEDGIAATDEHYSILIVALCRKNRIDEARAHLQKVGRSFRFIAPYNALLKAYSEAGKLTEALELMEEMKRSKARPTALTYNSMIQHLLDENENDRAQELFLEMIKVHGIELNEFSHALMIELKARREGLEEAERHFNKIVDNDIVKNDFIFNAMIRAYCSKDKYNKAKVVFERMKAKDIKGTYYTYPHLILAAFKCRQPQQAEAFWEEMKAIGDAPSTMTYSPYNHMVQGFYDCKQIDKAKAYFQESKITLPEKDGMLDCHDVDHAVAFFALEPHLQALQRTPNGQLHVITGKGLHSHHKPFAMRQFIQSRIQEHYPDLSVKIDSNPGVLLIKNPLPIPAPEPEQPPQTRTHCIIS